MNYSDMKKFIGLYLMTIFLASFGSAPKSSVFSTKCRTLRPKFSKELIGSYSNTIHYLILFFDETMWFEIANKIGKNEVLRFLQCRLNHFVLYCVNQYLSY